MPPVGEGPLSAQGRLAAVRKNRASMIVGMSALCELALPVRNRGEFTLPALIVEMCRVQQFG